MRWLASGAIKGRFRSGFNRKIPAGSSWGQSFPNFVQRSRDLTFPFTGKRGLAFGAMGGAKTGRKNVRWVADAAANLPC